MKYDFDRLQTIHCLDAVTIRVPQRWKSEPGFNGAWQCYEDDEETGTLWIRHEQFPKPEGDWRNPAFGQVLVNCMRHWTDDQSFPYLTSEITPIDNGYLWTRIQDTRNWADNEPIRDLGYMFLQVNGEGLLATDIKLVLPTVVLDDPEIHHLIDIMDREIRATKIEPPASGPANEDEAAFYPLQRNNFDGRFVLELPQTLDGQGEAQDEWVLHFEPGTVEAQLFVAVHDMELLDARGQPFTPAQDKFNRQAQEFMMERGVKDIAQVAGGVLGYEIYDEPGTAAPAASMDWREGPRRNHYWRYYRNGRGVTRQVHMILSLPQARAEAPRLRALVSVLNGAIRRAKFPDL